MSNEQLLERFKRYKARVGSAQALSYLTSKGVCATNADRLCRDEYKGEPRKKLRNALLDVPDEPRGIAS